MKKIFILTALSAVSLMLVQCSPKTSKSVSKPAAKTSAEKVAGIKNEYSEAQIAEGKAIFETSCGKCHKLKMPPQFTVSQWEPILERMNPKARLDEKQASLVRAYVLVNAKS